MSIPKFDTDHFDRYYCALVTPYKPDSLEVDEGGYRKLVRYFTKSEDFRRTRGALIVNPEAGEIFYLTPDERRRLIKIILEERPADMPIFAGCYGVRRDEVIASALGAKALGVDGIFVMPPAGTMEVTTAIDGSKNPEIWTNHVRAIAEATQLPLIVHPAHPRTMEWGIAVPIETVKMVLEEVPSVVGWKMIYGHAAAHFRVARYIRSLPRHVGILNAPHYCFHTALMTDLLDGMVQGSYNFAMEGLTEHLLAWQSGDIPTAKRIWNTKVMPIHDYIYADSSRLHIRYKLATWIRGLIAHPFMRPPMPEPRREEAERIYEIISRTGLSSIGQSEFEETLKRKEMILSSFSSGLPPL